MATRRKVSARSSTADFETAAVTSERYILRLYVAGSTPGSARAVENLRRICDELLVGRYDLEVVDVYQDPARARDEQVIAVPTLVRKLPAPLRRILGDLSDREHVLVGLDLKPVDEKKPQSAKKKKSQRG